MFVRMPTRWVHFRIPDDLHARIKAAAIKDRRSVSSWVTVACEKALEATRDTQEPDGSEVVQ